MKSYAAIKSPLFVVAFLALVFCSFPVTYVFSAQAGQILLNGRVKSIDLPVNTVVVTDYEGKDFKLNIEDQTIIAKFRDGRIKVGDDVNVKYRINEGKNIPFSLRKLAGC